MKKFNPWARAPFFVAKACLMALLFLAVIFPLPAQEVLVKKVAEDFSGQAWVSSPWNKAVGVIKLDEDKAPDAKSAKSLRVDINFPGDGFAFNSTEAPKPLYLPGNVKSITVRAKRSDAKMVLHLGCLDGWGRPKADGKDLGWDFKFTGVGEWQTFTFDVPADWVRPIAIAGISIHNFNFQNEKLAATYWVDDIEVETDISQADLVTGTWKDWKPESNPADPAKALKQVPETPLLALSFSTPNQGNVFAGETPRVALQIRNWKAGLLAGSATFSVTDETGAKVKNWEEKLSIDSLASLAYPIEAKRFGLYHVSVKVALPGASPLERQLTLASVPAQPELTKEQKLISPYGMNYHGGAERIFEPFKKAGIYWFRDYAWGLDQMKTAKGADGKYNNWPYYPAIMGDYEKLGLMVLPVMHAIKPPEMKGDKVVKQGPDEQWVRDMTDIIISFPNVTYWELDNEYDLPFKKNSLLEEPIKWKNYQLYHAKFGDLIDVLGSGKLIAVENGQAGIYPQRAEESVKSGAFAKIPVINCHHYCGTEPPEINAQNFNRGLSPGQTPGFFFDSLRGTKRAASADGKKRESWLTEFGWDNLVGPAVTAEQQAAYLQRGFLLSFAAGTDKSFWFYNFDAAKPVQIFDSCGLFTWDVQPKLALSAMAGLSTILPRPVYVGSISAGPNTAGYVFENDGVLVAGLWTIEGNQGPQVTFKAKQLYDYFGNKQSGLSAALKMAPVYAVGLDKADPLYLQTAYSLESPYLIVATAGDPAEAIVGLNNNRAKEFKAQVKMTLPDGWTSTQMEASVSAKPGEKTTVKMPFVVGAAEHLGVKDVIFTVTEEGKPIKTIPLRVVVQRPYAFEVSSLAGAPGPAQVQATITNKSAMTRSATLRLKLPQGWSTANATLEVKEVQPGETRTVKVDLTWKAEWKENESASLVLEEKSVVMAEAPIIPNQYRLLQATKFVIDGDLKDWSDKLQFPSWMTGSTAGPSKAKVWLAWSPEGLYGAAEVEDSKVVADDPKSFWGCDVLELFFSTEEAKRKDWYQKGDHQFWLVPLIKENRVYTGRWKVKDEIKETQYDLPGVKSVARKTPQGYVMEFFLPPSVFDSYGLKAGGQVGLNFNLTVRGMNFDREVYWPKNKATGVNLQPSQWGTVKLGE